MLNQLISRLIQTMQYTSPTIGKFQEPVIYNVRYATCTTSCASASSWTNTSGISLSNIHDVALAIDSNDALHIAGYDSDNKDIIYLACTSSCTSTSSWSNISAVTTGEVGARLSIAVDSTNNPHISYQAGALGHTCSVCPLDTPLALHRV